MSLALLAPAADGANIKQTQALIARLSTQLSHEQARSEALDQEYLRVESQLQTLDGTITQLEMLAAAKQSDVKQTSHTLVRAILRTYVDGAAAMQGMPIFTQDPSQVEARRVYEQVVNGNLNLLQETQRRQQRSLERTLAVESRQRNQAFQVARQLKYLLAQNKALVAETQATLATVSHDLAQKIIGYEIYIAVYSAQHHNSKGVENAVAAAAAVGGTSAANKVIAAAAAVTKNTNVGGTPAGSKQGLAAVRAAMSQIGVPYVWGGESPGFGFDCSGLTQWAWGRAGFSIPRTAAEQYYATKRVPLSDLRPGDLLFYYNLDNDHQIDHEVMYVGSGPWGTNTIIAAAHTGTRISLEPLFTYGLYGAGRP